MNKFHDLSNVWILLLPLWAVLLEVSVSSSVPFEFGAHLILLFTFIKMSSPVFVALNFSGVTHVRPHPPNTVNRMLKGIKQFQCEWLPREVSWRLPDVDLMWVSSTVLWGSLDCTSFQYPSLLISYASVCQIETWKCETFSWIITIRRN